MYFKNLSLKKYELKNRDNIKGTLNGKKNTHREAKSCGSIPGIDTKSRLSLLFILSLVPGDFSPGSPVFPSPQKPSLQIQMPGVH